MLADTMGIPIKPRATENGELILLVDDEEGFFKMVGLCLTKAGYKVLRAANGREALMQMRETEGVDLVFTDINMPVMDGGTLIRELNQTHSTAKIIVTTGVGGAAFEEELKTMGVRHFLRKPFTPAILLLAVRQAPDD